MKNTVTITLAIFWIFMLLILVTGGISYFSSSTNSNIPKDSLSSSTPLATSQKGVSGVLLTPNVIAKHKGINDCWLIISGKVYDVTSFLDAHPGGIAIILPYCGKEATQAFDTRGGTGQHSQRADQMLKDYYLGDLNGKILQ